MYTQDDSRNEGFVNILLSMIIGKNQLNTKGYSSHSIGGDAKIWEGFLCIIATQLVRYRD